MQRMPRKPALVPIAILGLALLVFVAPAGASTGLPASTPTAAPAQSAPPGDEVGGSFVRAAQRWNVPIEVLMAVGYAESHWEQRSGEPSLDGGVGIMHMRPGKGGTLAKAAQITGLGEGELTMSAGHNIEGGAALLSYISQKLNNTSAKKQTKPVLSSWYEAVEEYSSSLDPSVREAYARQVFQFIRDGATATLTSGERVQLPATDVPGLPQQGPPAPTSPDYGPALWVPAYSNNYTVGRPYPPLDKIVIHDTEGSYSSAINWFQNPSSGVSAHYVVRSSDGQITQMVRDANTAHHTGVWSYNVRAIGVEHEGYMNQTGWYTEPMYQSSALLVSTLADRYNIPKDRAHIIAHAEIPNQTHRDPGTNWDWNRYLALVRRDWQRAGLIDNGGAGFEAVPPQIDPQHYWYVYNGGYNGSNCLTTTSVTSSQYSYNSATWTSQMPSTGLYDVYAFVPYVNNGNSDTESARYRVDASDGTRTVTVSQKAITDLGLGGWAHLGRFSFNGGAPAGVHLDDVTGESGRSVWFDAVMWIPAASGAPPPTPPPPATGTPVPTNTQVPASTAVPTFTPTAQAIWTPGPCNMMFTDLPDTNWAYSYIAALYCRNVVTGYSDGTFRPNSSATRGQFTKMLALGMGWTREYPPYADFSDVLPGSTYFPYVATAYRLGVINGYPDGTFRPNEPVTRAQAVKMIVIAEGWSLEYPLTPTFSDVLVDNWAFGYIEAAYSHSIINGYTDGTFRPQNAITRAQVAKVLALATGP